MIQVEQVPEVLREVHVVRDMEVHEPVGDVGGELEEVHLLEEVPEVRRCEAVVQVEPEREVQREVHVALDAEIRVPVEVPVVGMAKRVCSSSNVVAEVPSASEVSQWPKAKFMRC